MNYGGFYYPQIKVNMDDMAYTMYDTLLQLPLFQGMSKDELSDIIERVRLDFQKIDAGETFFSQGDVCDSLVFVLSGEVEAETIASYGKLSFVERYKRAMIIEPYSLFGMQPRFKSTYRALGTVSLLVIDKQYIYSVLFHYEVFRINLLNLLCNRAEQLYDKVWGISAQELEGRLINFVHSLCTTMHGPKILRVRMEDLACLLDDTRLNVSNVLNKWRKENLIAMCRKEFIFYDIEKLLSIRKLI